MKALSVRQPIAYLAGVLCGDGWLNDYFGLRVADLDFSQSFCDAIAIGFKIHKQPHKDYRGYWVVRIYNGYGRFNCLLDYQPKSELQLKAWLRGLFDSEGNTSLCKLKRGKNCYSRRVSAYNTELTLLEKAQIFLYSLQIPVIVRPIKNSESHFGEKQMYELVLKSSKENYSYFALKVGFSIERKVKVLDAIIKSYLSPSELAVALRVAQLKGAAVRKQKTMRITLPKVLKGIKELIKKGVKPICRNCRVIPGYNSIQRYFHQADLIKMAMEVK